MNKYYKIGYVKSKGQQIFELHPILNIFGKLAIMYHFDNTGLGVSFYRQDKKYFGIIFTVVNFNLLIRNENMR